MPKLAHMPSTGDEHEAPRPLPLAQLGITTSEVAGGWCVVSVDGEVDLATAPLLESALLHLSASHRYHGFVIDLSSVDHFDSSGLRVLVRLIGNVGSGSVKLAAPHPNLEAMLTFSGLDRVLNVCPSVADATA